MCETQMKVWLCGYVWLGLVWLGLVGLVGDEMKGS